ncbi:MAG: hypothetical protein FK734_18580 [Asgard group archaeon]|nr:hypothetical protein [Asgard group archaeon]
MTENNSIKETTDKKRIKFKDLQPKRRTFYLMLIFSFSSLIVTVVFGVIMHFSSLVSSSGLFDILPGNFIIEITILWFIMFLGFLIMMPLFPYISKLYIFIHKLVKFFRYQYSVVETEDYYFKFKKILARIHIPYLFSFVVGYWFATWFFIPTINIPEENTIAISIMLYFLFSVIAMPLTIFLVPPLWLLDDTGIIAMKKRRNRSRTIPDIEGPSVFFNNFYTGSTYTLALLTIIDFVRDFIGHFDAKLLGYVCYIILLLMPCMIFTITYMYEVFYVSRKKVLQRILPNKLVDKMPKTVVDISAFDPFYYPEGLSEKKQNDQLDNKLEEVSDFNIDTEFS